jgi:hypothetical protein
VGAGEAGGDAYPPLVAIGRSAADILVSLGCSRLLHLPCFLMVAAVRRKAELLYRGETRAWSGGAARSEMSMARQLIGGDLHSNPRNCRTVDL